LLLELTVALALVGGDALAGAGVTRGQARRAGLELGVADLLAHQRGLWKA